MNKRLRTILEQLTPLTPLDLGSCRTVSDIVAGMAKCSFGARMLGEVAETLTKWITEGKTSGHPPILVYDGSVNRKLHPYIQKMGIGTGWFRGPWTSELATDSRSDRVLVVGPYYQRNEDAFHAALKPGGAIFVNAEMQCKPGQVRDGFFPNVVFADPTLVIPVLYHVLKERINGEPSSVWDLMKDLEGMDGVGKEVVHGAHTLKAMLNDTDCTVMLTLSGAMTIAKMQLLVADLIDTGRISYVAATGALMAHGLVEGSECRHFKYDPRFTDEELAAEALNRVTDTIEPEGNFDHIEKIVAKIVDRRQHGRQIGSSALYRELGEYLDRMYPDRRSILASAYRHKVPVVTPAVIDSEIGNDIFVLNQKRRERGKGQIIFNQEADTRILFALATKAKRLGIFTIGGGVPRNNTQNVAPLIEIYNARLGTKLPPGQFFYGCRIDPAPMSLGHLSGCTYREGGTWRKFDFDGKLAEVRCDATIAWPLIQQFALERLAR